MKKIIIALLALLISVCAVGLAACTQESGGDTDTVTTESNLSLQGGESFAAYGTGTQKRFIEVSAESSADSKWGFTLTSQSGVVCTFFFASSGLVLSEEGSETLLRTYTAGSGGQTYALAADGGMVYVFLNDQLLYPYENEACAAASLGIVNGESGAISFSSVRYSGAERYADEIIAQAGEASLSVQGEGVSASQFGKAVAANAKIYPENEVTVSVQVPQDRILAEISLTNGGRKVNLTEISETEWSFLPRAGGAYVLTVRYESLPTLVLKPEIASVTVGGKSYALYEDYYDPQTDWKDMTVRVVRADDGEAFTATFADGTARIEDLTPGAYSIEYTYNGVTQIVDAELSAGETAEISLPVSPVQLGGDGILNPSYSSDWEFYEGTKDSVVVQKATFVFEGGKTGTTYYMEGVFDTTQTAMGRDDVYGLLIAHDNQSIDRFLVAGIYGSSVYVAKPASWGSVGEDNIWPVANIDDIEGAENFDRTAIKLGVLRDGSSYYFFVNDTYAARYDCALIAVDGEGNPEVSNIGIAAAGDGGAATVRCFNYSFDSELIGAMKALAPARGDIDVYFIAGQSNASGYSMYDYDQARAEDPRYAYGFTNIWYAGNSRSTAGAFASQRELEWQLARIGLGRSTDSRNYFGPELGMADALSSYYNAESGKTAAIIKYAAGGTSLLNNLGGENAPEGNWVSPSYQATLTSGVSPLTGGLYRNLLAEAQKRIGELKDMGYTVHVKGLYWMQGESDVGQEAEYKKAFEFFVSDIRHDLGEIADADLSSMPIYVGQISETTGGDTSGRPQTFINMQNTLSDIEGVYIIQSGQYKIGYGFDSGCYDVWHWSYRAQLAIGNLAGDKILEVMGA